MNKQSTNRGIAGTILKVLVIAFSAPYLTYLHQNFLQGIKFHNLLNILILILKMIHVHLLIIL